MKWSGVVLPQVSKPRITGPRVRAFGQEIRTFLLVVADPAGAGGRGTGVATLEPRGDLVHNLANGTAAGRTPDAPDHPNRRVLGARDNPRPVSDGGVKERKHVPRGYEQKHSKHEKKHMTEHRIFGSDAKERMPVPPDYERNRNEHG